MSIVRTLIGNIKGPAGATGATGATGAAGANGADGAAATVNVGTVSTTAYGNPAQVINSGTESAAVLDFVIPQGQPGEEVTDMSGLTLGTMTTQTSQFPTPQVGDNGAVLWGKVVKYFSDLRTLIGTKLNTSNVVNNFTTTESGYALDARAGKTLNDNINTKLPTSLVYNNNNVRIQRAGNLYFASSNGATAANFKAAFAQYYTQGGGVFRTIMYDFTLKDFIIVTATNGSSELGMFAVTGWGSGAQVADADVIQGEMFWGA